MYMNLTPKFSSGYNSMLLIKQMQQFESYAAMFFGIIQVLKKAFSPIDFVLYLVYWSLPLWTPITYKPLIETFWISQLNDVQCGVQTTPLNNYMLMIFMMTFFAFPPRDSLRLLVCYRAHFSVQETVEIAFVAISLRLTSDCTIVLAGMEVSCI